MTTLFSSIFCETDLRFLAVFKVSAHKNIAHTLHEKNKGVLLRPQKILRYGVIGNTSDSGSEEFRFEP